MKSQQMITYQFRLSEEEYLVLAQYALRGLEGATADEEDPIDFDGRAVVHAFVRYVPVADPEGEGAGDEEPDAMVPETPPVSRLGFLRKKTG